MEFDRRGHRTSRDPAAAEEPQEYCFSIVNECESNNRLAIVRLSRFGLDQDRREKLWQACGGREVNVFQVPDLVFGENPARNVLSVVERLRCAGKTVVAIEIAAPRAVLEFLLASPEFQRTKIFLIAPKFAQDDLGNKMVVGRDPKTGRDLFACEGYVILRSAPCSTGRISKPDETSPLQGEREPAWDLGPSTILRISKHDIYPEGRDQLAAMFGDIQIVENGGLPFDDDPAFAVLAEIQRLQSEGHKIVAVELTAPPNALAQIVNCPEFAARGILLLEPTFEKESVQDYATTGRHRGTDRQRLRFANYKELIPEQF